MFMKWHGGGAFLGIKKSLPRFPGFWERLFEVVVVAVVASAVVWYKLQDLFGNSYVTRERVWKLQRVAELLLLLLMMMPLKLRQHHMPD